MWWIIVIGIIVFIIYRLTKEHDEYVDKHITSFGGMRVKYKSLIDYLIEPQGARIIKEANEYIVISLSLIHISEPTRH